MREIKFRAWGSDPEGEPAKYHRWENICHCFDLWVHNENIIIEQFTGLKDSSGVDIYEGDILNGVSANPFSMGEVKAYEVMWGVDHWHINGTGFSMQDLFNYTNNNIEVVGNIHENKDLLK